VQVGFRFNQFETQLRQTKASVLSLLATVFLLSACSNDDFDLGAKDASSTLSNPAPTEKADVVLIINSTTSMKDEREKLNQSFQNLVSQLSGTDWRVAVMTASGGGDLLPIEMGSSVPDAANCFFKVPEKNKYWVSSADKDALGRLSVTMACGSAKEIVKSKNGIASLYNAMINFKSGSGAISTFFRSKSHWLFIMLSDQDEKVRLDSTGKKALSGALPSQIMDFKNTYSMPFKTFTVHSIVVPPNDDVCLRRVTSSSFGANNQTYGNYYAELSTDTHGLVGSICSDNYSSVLDSFAADFKSKLKTTELPCEPMLDTIKVYLNGKLVNVKFTVDGKLLILDPTSPPGDYQFQYTCKVGKA
jgi:hypothetical protein